MAELNGTITMQIRTRRGWTTITMDDLQSDSSLYPDKISSDDKATVVAKAQELGFEGDVVTYTNSNTGNPFYCVYADKGSRISASTDLSFLASRRK